MPRLPGFARSLPRVSLASAIAGLIVAALILMTPNQIFEAIVVATGLPGIIAAAQPPLGANARIVTALVFALLITLGAWIALSIASRVRKAEGSGLPRQRRADAHPDAPPRRPIFARDDLGAPLDLVDVVPARTALWAERDWTQFADEAPLEPEPALFAAEPDPDPDPDPVPAFDPPFDPLEDQVVTGPLRVDHGDKEPDAPQAGEPRARRFDPATLDSLVTLADRLEAGLARRRALHAAPVYPSNVAPHQLPRVREDSDMDTALRDALDALKRFQSRG